MRHARRASLANLSPYRDTRSAMAERVDEVRERLHRIDRNFEAQVGGLPPPSRRRLRKLRNVADLSDSCSQDVGAREVLTSERAVLHLERELDETLELSLQVSKSIRPLLPSASVILRWAGIGTAAVAILGLLVFELGMTDFMRVAVGLGVDRAQADLHCDRLGYEATRAAVGDDFSLPGQWAQGPGLRVPGDRDLGHRVEGLPDTTATASRRQAIPQSLESQ